jgi:hypothetical protein
MPENQGEQTTPETVEVVQAPGAEAARWSPVVGLETTQLLAHLNIGTSANTVREEALGILSRCVPPTAPAEADTGIVVGYVQSGKTISFTTVAALARDNGYRMVIVIAGVTKYLYGQCTLRLERDLRLQTRHDPRSWVHFPKPTPAGNAVGNIQGALDAWDDPVVPAAQRSTVLITVMKNKTQLNKLTSVLSGLNLSNVPTLIIDDEADQAGLNTKVRQGEFSATYSSLLALRQRVPHHTFLQYTATPQAPLLINLIDILSPSFARVLTPGPDYVGGRQFFIEQPGLVRNILPAEIPTEEAPLEGPPDSLLRAMRLFFLGVASGLRRGGASDNRSMMVHPSIKMPQHAAYFSWVQAIQNNWKTILALPEGESDRQDLIAEFQVSYQDLRGTVPDLESFADLCLHLPRAVRSTNIHKVNSDGSPSGEINWRSVYPHILVGGEILGRGFTIEGLTTTYMPRGVGVGNADTVQQRARFFGYKRRYLSFCRVYLEQGVEEAYRKYVAHEEDVRERLIRHSEDGTPLSDWKRAFFLNMDLRPTRANVLDLDYMQDRLSNDWFYPDAPHYSPAAVQHNRDLTHGLISRFQWEQDAGHPDRTEMEKHLVTRAVSLRQLYDEFLTRFSTPRAEDSRRFTGALLQIEAFLRTNPAATCTIYQMSPGNERRRELLDGDIINNLFQGKSREIGARRRGEIYPGDQAIVADQGLTLQLYNLTLHRGGNNVVTDIPVIAIFVPEEMAADTLVQDQGGPAAAS